MHCIDSDYSVFSILPPYNVIEAQLIVNGQLVTRSNGYTVTYQAVADPSGSFNSTAAGKGNFYDFALPLYGVNLPVDSGLLDWGMPGTNNTPQAMLFEQTNTPVPPLPGVTTPVNWWRAEGIPISPYDDAGKKNPYPLMLLAARDAGNNVIATNQIVLPISDEMDCRACHASGSADDARPAAGWVWDGNQERDFRLNILRLHDQHEFTNHAGLYAAALLARGFNPAGLYRSVTADKQPILCAACHADVALNILNSYSNIPPFTASMHVYHGHVLDPILKTPLDDVANRSACYRCHPGSTTRCLRGAMGGAIAADGSMEMQCQSCHGNMSNVGSISRTGWLDEPACQSCHTGTAMSNNGQIRYTTCFTNSTFGVRIPANQTFATQSNTPAAGISLYRFSVGHGGLQCEACHGSTHAEFPSTHLNDNLRNIQIQGHAGVMVECSACHPTTPTDYAGGPHGMHPVGTNWVTLHPDYAEGHSAQCRACHGADYRGTVLSRMQADRTLNAFGTKTFFRGAVVGCYNCHNGAGSESANNSIPPTVSNVSTNTTNDRAVPFTLPATGTDLTLWIVSQPVNGSVGLNGSNATYFPNPGFVGTDTFTFAAYDGSKDSALATGTVVVAQGQFSLIVTAQVPPTNPAGWPVAFATVPVVTNSAATVTFDWDFGDGSPHGTNQFPIHTYTTTNTYSWNVVASVSNMTAGTNGSIVISAPMALAFAATNDQAKLIWPDSAPDTLLEESPSLEPNATWTWVTNAVINNSGQLQVTVPLTESNLFFRIRQPW
ncbi:MAG TPA: Ig-like domain-containing protein [Verrucomicrobiae bacterium]|nr:Ig-like domain-containing protein [Verrucomicrobiae bacterium]